MTRHISQTRLLAHGKYPAQVIAHYAKAVKYQPHLSISTFAKLYQPAIGAQLSVDYCPAVDQDKKLDVHKRIMQQISIDALANCLTGNSKEQCNGFMLNPDAVHAHLSAKTLNHPICPKTMDFYTQVLGKSDPVQFHGQLVNAIVACMQDGWRDYVGREWTFLERGKFCKYFSKRVQEFTNLEASTDVDIGVQEPDLEPITFFVNDCPPKVEPIGHHAEWHRTHPQKHQYYDEDEEKLMTDVEVMEHYDPVEGHGHSGSCSRSSSPHSSSSSDEEGSEHMGEETPAGLKVKNVLLDTQSTLKPYNAGMAKPLAKDYRPTLNPISQPVPTEKETVRANLVPIAKNVAAVPTATLTPARPVRPTLEATINKLNGPLDPAAAAALKQRLVPIAQVTKPAATSTLTSVTVVRPEPVVRKVAPDRLGGESLPPGKAIRSNLVAIGSEVAKSRKAVATAVPVQPVVKRPMAPLIIEEQQADPSDKFGNVRQSIRWLETYLENEGPSHSENLVFFAPTNAVANRIVEQAAKKGKLVAVQTIMERHICEHRGAINDRTLSTIGGHTVKIGQRGKIELPAVKSAWTDFIGEKNIAGFNVHIYSHQNLFTHE